MSESEALGWKTSVVDANSSFEYGASSARRSFAWLFDYISGHVSSTRGIILTVLFVSHR